MNDDTARAEYEQQVAALAGSRISEVTYWGLETYGDVDEEDPAWDYGEWHNPVMALN